MCITCIRQIFELNKNLSDAQSIRFEDRSKMFCIFNVDLDDQNIVYEGYGHLLTVTQYLIVKNASFPLF